MGTADHGNHRSAEGSGRVRYRGTGLSGVRRMKSPFPGMDPYLEGSPGDFHASLTVYGCDQLQSQLPDDLVARIEQYEVRLPDAPKAEPESIRRIRITTVTHLDKLLGV